MKTGGEGLPREEEAARRLALAYGWNTTSYQILNPGIGHWLAPELPAVVGYVRRPGYLVAAGAPACPGEKLREAAGAFERFAREQGRRVCWVCAEERLIRTLADGEHASIAIGAQPEWEPAGWERVVNGRGSLRAQLNRARNKGVWIEEVENGDEERLPELRQCVEEWLHTRRLPPLHFLTEPQTLGGVMADRVILAARRKGKTVAFLLASPVGPRNGYLVEQIARSPRAPNGTSELLIDAAMRQFAGEGRSYATLGLVALAWEKTEEMAANPWWVRATMRLARAHAGRFYNFRGLLRFRTKLEPDGWESVFAITNERRFSPLALYAMGGAFSGISPALALAIGVGKAARQEWKWLRNRVRGSGKE